MKILDRYIDQLLEKSSPSRPIWNIEKIRQGAKPSWNYMDGCMINAILELYHITQKEEYLDFADRFIDYFVEEDGSIHSYDPKEHNLDNVNTGKTLFDLYDLTGKEKYRLAIDQTRSGWMDSIWHSHFICNMKLLTTTVLIAKTAISSSSMCTI